MTVTLTSLLLVLGCSLAFFGTDLLRKLLGVRVPPLPLLFFLSAGPAPVFLAWYLGAGDLTVGVAYLVPGIGSVILNIASNLAYLEALRKSPLSRTVPVLALTPVFTTLLAAPLLGEIPSSRQLAGVVVVVLGVLWLQLLHSDSDAGEGAAGRGLMDRGTLLMVGVALLWSLAMPLDKMAMAASSPAFHGVVLTFGVALGVLAMIFLRGEPAKLVGYLREGRLLTLAVALTLAALALQLLAVSQTWVGLVESMKRAVGSVMAVIVGAAFLSEPAGLGKVLAVVLVGAGVVLVML